MRTGPHPWEDGWDDDGYQRRLGPWLGPPWLAMNWHGWAGSSYSDSRIHPPVQFERAKRANLRELGVAGFDALQ